jgi:hypothetical protein
MGFEFYNISFDFYIITTLFLRCKGSEVFVLWVLPMKDAFLFLKDKPGKSSFENYTPIRDRAKLAK